MSHQSFIDLPPLLSAKGTVRLPGSKSITNRALLLAALSDGQTELRDLLLSDDTARMLEALTALGVGVDLLDNGVCRVSGVAGVFPVKAADLFWVMRVRLSLTDGRTGTVIRLLRLVRGAAYARAADRRSG